ncbi:hypothetical protein GALMADRAFT_245006 [Galerina marginata CBS 339.88]|uniref:Transcription factor TFIIIC subunit tfc4 n=1 Tax=Galerina marginata (strain CBS 339.88) TaxID=685588 RepID=A0A067TGE3_GALM3|nr:hypothetical protein GALMADRAFT_245006 [Galerina marginata CBS 339.88]
MQEDDIFGNWEEEEEEDPTDSESSEGDSDEESSSEELESDGDEPTVEEVAAEQEIEGDFDRLVKNIRLRDGSSSASTNLLTRDWDFDIEEREAEFKDDLREASGIGRKRKRKGRGRTSGPVLSQQVKALIGDGNQAYVDNDLSEAIRIMQEVIRIEPRAASAWSVLGQCYEDMKEGHKALQLRIMAAHLRHDAEEWDRLGRQSREHGYNQQALYCYRKVYSLDPTNVDALWDRASLAKEIGDFRIARHAFLAILKRFPHDLTVLRELHTILVELSDLSTCASLLQGALDHYMKAYPSGHGENISGGGFSKLDLLLLADLYNVLGEHGRAVETIRRGTRWLQGRSDQKYWDLCEDDREYDSDGWPPRSGADEGGPVQAGGYELDPNTRHRLAVARIKMGDVEEGELHANSLLAEDVLDYSVLFAEIADAYFERGLYAEAKPIYELLGGDPATSSIYILLQTAACMRNVDELKDAAEVYEHVRLADPTNNDAKMKLAEVYEIMGEPRKALDLVYEVIDSRKKRNRGAAHNQAEESTNPVGTSLFAEDKAPAKTKATATRQNRLSHTQLKELEMQKEKEVVRGYQRMKDLWPSMLAGELEAEREWLLEGEKLVDMFRETRNLFSTSRTNPFRGMFPRNRPRKQAQTEADEDQMASRLQLDLELDSLARKSAKSGEKPGAVNIFRGISFDNWLRLFMQYCFTLTKRGQYDTADDILRHVMVSNAYQAKERQDSIRLALIACAIAGERYAVVVEQSRKLITQNQFNNEPLRILVASLASGLRTTDAFITSTLQKHLFREMKLSDTAVKNPEILKWNPLNKRYAPTGQAKTAELDEEAEDGDAPSIDDPSSSTTSVSSTDKAARHEIPTKSNPVMVTIYGQICIAAKSYQSAIFYLLHAYDYCPDDPMVCLCLAIASVGRAMQRQSDNRHHLVVQAMAFLSKYRKLRGVDDQGVREVEYNFGRTFHQLGLFSHAVKHYERVLDMAEKAGDDHFARESAYNLSLIFVFTGAAPLADALYRRWLSI